MANHVRRQLREAIATALTGLATTAARVFQSRLHRMQENEVPGLRVYTVPHGIPGLRAESREDAEPATMHPNPIIERTVPIAIDGVATANDNLDDTLDTIAKEVETALAPGVTIGARTIGLAYRGCTIAASAEGEHPAGVITLNYEARIFNAANAPDVFS